MELTNATQRKKSVLLASWGNTLHTKSRFSSHFDTVIMPHQVTKLETAPGWIKQHSSIAMEGSVLTGIYAVCYMSKPVRDDASLGLVQSEYYAVLGDLLVHQSSENPNFPPSKSWLVYGKYIKWSSGSEGSKKLSIKLIWKLEDGDASLFPNYNIYVQKQENAAEVAEYLGAATVEAFYVSDLLVPSAISSLKFIIQVCDLNGTIQKLEDSPYHELQVDDGKLP